MTIRRIVERSEKDKEREAVARVIGSIEAGRSLCEAPVEWRIGTVSACAPRIIYAGTAPVIICMKFNLSG